jgi:hypothetical protein
MLFLVFNSTFSNPALNNSFAWIHAMFTRC